MPITTIQFEVTMDIRHGDLESAELAKLIDRSVREFMMGGHAACVKTFHHESGPERVAHDEPTTIPGVSK